MKGFDRDYILKQLTDYAHNPQEALITVIREGSILVANDIYDVVAPNLIDKDAIEVKAKGGAIDNMYIFTHPIGRWLVSTYIELFYQLFANAVMSVVVEPKLLRNYILDTRISIINSLNSHSITRMRFITGASIPAYDATDLYENPLEYFANEGLPKPIFPRGKSGYYKHPNDSMIDAISVHINNVLKKELNEDKLDLIIKVNTISLARYLSLIDFNDWVYAPLRDLGIKTTHTSDISSKEYIETVRKLLAL